MWQAIKRALGFPTEAEKAARRAFRQQYPDRHIAWTWVAATGAKVWFEGHWGLQYYGELRGLREVDFLFGGVPPERLRLFQILKTIGPPRPSGAPGPAAAR